VQAALEKILKKHSDSCVALVVPDPLAGVVRHHLSGGELSDLLLVESECGSWEQLEVDLRNPEVPHARRSEAISS
jgi:hypothetical protein